MQGDSGERCAGVIDLSLHVLDLLQNCAHAGAAHVRLDVRQDLLLDLLSISIRDDGRGMDDSELAKAMDPFYSSKGKKVGLGLPMAALAARMAGGSFRVESCPGAGTTVRASFKLSHVDRQPLGDLTASVTTFLAGNPGIDLDFVFHGPEGRAFHFDSSSLSVGEGEMRSQIAFLSLVEETMRAGLAEAGFVPDGGGVSVEVR